MTDLESGHVRYERDGPIATVTFDRPDKRNALSAGMIRDTLAAIRDAEDVEDVRVIVLTGAGGDFCSGGDLKALIPDTSEGMDWDTLGPEDETWQLPLRYEQVTTPMVAAVEGVCVAAGMELLEATDIRIAGESARFGHQEPRWGLFPAGSATVRLPRQLSYVKAMEYLLTGELFEVEHALEAGLVNEVVEDGEALERAREFADSIARNSPLAVQRIKESVLRNLGKPPEDGCRLETELAREVWASEDAKEGREAFLEDREPDFS